MAPTGNTICECAYCASTNLRLGPDGRGECADCGAKLSATDGVVRVRVRAETAPNDFIRAAWIYLAAKDAPLDVFEKDFGEFGVVEYPEVKDVRKVRVPYHMNVGTDTREPYTTFETYFEDEPRIMKDYVYDAEQRKSVLRDVVRYVKVQKEREVTKYRTFTDWAPESSELSTTSAAWAETGERMFSTSFSETDGGISVYGEVTLDGEDKADVGDVPFAFDGDEFLLRINEISPGTLAAPNDEECARMNISSSARSELEKKHLRNISAEVKKSADGKYSKDKHYKDLGFTTNVTESSTCVYLVPEYEAVMTYGGRGYAVRAFPFGRLVFHGDKIENTEGPDSFARRKRTELSEEREKIPETVEKEIWLKSRGSLIAATCLLVLSIIGSVLLSVLSLGVAVVLSVALPLFAVALIVFACGAAASRRRERETPQMTVDAEKELESRINEEIKTYTANYKKRQFSLLNKKLESMGLKPATPGEIREMEV